VDFPPVIELRERLLPMVVDGVQLVNDALGDGKRVLAEGANAALLDVDPAARPTGTPFHWEPEAIPTDEELLRFHTPAMVAKVRDRSLTGGGYLDSGDTPAWRGVHEAAAQVVGATLEAVAAIMHGQVERAFIPIAGLHHATRESAAGFCVYNDIGVAIDTLRSQHGLQRIAYVDIDAHHGDGVFYAYESDPQLIFADIHEDASTLYPGTGAADEIGTGAAAGTKLNLPLAAGSTDADFDRVWPQVTAHLQRFEPQFIILQCGTDSLAGDPLTHLQLSAESHARAARELAALAVQLGHGRILALGGGGYNRANLAVGWNAVVEALLSP
jgi:acetoin utilization protein AcuC